MTTPNPFQSLDKAEPRAVTRAELARELAETELCHAEPFGAWLECCSEQREASSYWGPISSYELLHIALMGKGTPEQTHAAMRSLRRRFLRDHAYELAQRAYELETRA